MQELRKKNSVNIVQLTDTHIFSNPAGTFDGVNTAASLEKIISHVRSSDYHPDLVLVTGDLVHETTSTAYENLIYYLKMLEWPVFCLPGNHDLPALMYPALDKAGIGTSRLIILNKWLIFMLDSFLPGTHSGRLDQEQLQFLDRWLELYNTRYALICLHHSPMSVGSNWMDTMPLEDPGALLSVIDNHKQVKGVLWGHIHQEFQANYNEVLMIASPSTCLQFMPGSDHYIKDASSSPGYRRIMLTESGEINTEVVRVSL